MDKGRVPIHIIYNTYPRHLLDLYEDCHKTAEEQENLEDTHPYFNMVAQDVDDFMTWKYSALWQHKYC